MKFRDNEIQNVILNNERDPSNRNLYYTFSEQLNSFVLDFGTYFNTLWIQSWKEYTDISSFYLQIKFRGECTISIIQSHLAGIQSQYSGDEEISRVMLYREKLSSSGLDYIQIKIPKVDLACRMIHFTIEYNKKCDFEYIDGFYAVPNCASSHPIKTAIIICTYKRERHLQANIKTLKKYFNSNQDLAEIYDVFIVDNDSSLPRDIESNNIYLFPNKNTGGSGGFARGILEALRAETKYTHVILMDDDIKINTESLHRTYALSSLINDHYSRSFISGSMLRSDIKDFQWEARARINGLRLDLYSALSLSEFSNLLRNEAFSTKHTPYDYAAWWYCCIPLNNIGLNKLPFPFFIRGDDIDYSLKYADKIIHLNGICVWHEPFDSRRSNVMDIYMAIRNFFTINILHKISLVVSVCELAQIFAGNIFTYNYSGAYLVYCGLSDAITEKEIFREDQLALLGRYKQYNEVEEEVSIDIEKAIKKTNFNFLQKILAILTYGGHLLPSFLFRKQALSTAGYVVSISKCFLSKQVIIYNPVTGKSIVRNINRLKAFSLSFRFASLLLKFIFGYAGIARQVHKKEQNYRTFEFWKNHLELD